jgi:hypothetical protein
MGLVWTDLASNLSRENEKGSVKAERLGCDLPDKPKPNIAVTRGGHVRFLIFEKMG